MSYWARELLQAAPDGETQEALVDRVLQAEADRCSELVLGMASRYKGMNYDLLLAAGLVVRAHLGNPKQKRLPT